MQSLVRAVRSQCRISSQSHIVSSGLVRSSRIISTAFDDANSHTIASSIRNFNSLPSGRKLGCEWASLCGHGMPSSTFFNGSASSDPFHRAAVSALSPVRCFTTAANPVESLSHNPPVPGTDVPARIKFKRLDKTARNIMQILDKEAVEQVRSQREIPDIKPGYIIQLKLEVPENKRRITTIKGIVIARRNAGLNTTFRIRRLVAGVGVENLLPLYSPNIKEITVLDKKKVRRAKLYYLRDKMNALRK